MSITRCDRFLSLSHLGRCSVTIQFPDPGSKIGIAKRRLVQPELVAELATYLAIGVVFLQSDIEALAVEMCDLCAHPAFQRQGQDWLTETPTSSH